MIGQGYWTTINQKELKNELNFGFFNGMNESAVKVAIHRLRRRFTGTPGYKSSLQSPY